MMMYDRHMHDNTSTCNRRGQWTELIGHQLQRWRKSTTGSQGHNVISGIRVEIFLDIFTLHFLQTLLEEIQ